MTSGLHPANVLLKNGATADNIPVHIGAKMQRLDDTPPDAAADPDTCPLPSKGLPTFVTENGNRM